MVDNIPFRRAGQRSEEIQGKSTVGNHDSEDEHLNESIKDYDWSELECSYMQMMEYHEKVDEELREQITQLLQILTSWSQTTVVHDEIRALKRFKTQMHHVQNSEESLEKKRSHYIDVVKAFESALALLNDRVRR